MIYSSGSDSEMQRFESCRLSHAVGLSQVRSPAIVMHRVALMIWTFSAGGKLFAYQPGVLIVGYSYGYFAARDLLRMGACLTVVEFLALLLMIPFYWPLIGLK
jgi:di/tricarboxylate transporter